MGIIGLRHRLLHFPFPTSVRNLHIAKNTSQDPKFTREHNALTLDTDRLNRQLAELISYGNEIGARQCCFYATLQSV
jgi:hypothetical protein